MIIAEDEPTVRLIVPGRGTPKLNKKERELQALNALNASLAEIDEAIAALPQAERDKITKAREATQSVFTNISGRH
jgi:hypothetical protein